jgi:hypothetical protein
MLLRAATLTLSFIILLTLSSCIRSEYVYESSDGTTIVRSAMPTVEIAWQEQTATSDLYAWSGQWTGPAFDSLAKSSGLQLSNKWTVDGASHVTGTFIPKLDPSATTQPDAVIIRRDAGTLTLNRSGEASLRINPQYLAELSSITGESIPPHRGRELFAYNLSLSYARSIKDAGYKPTFQDLLTLDRHGIRADYAKAVRAAGYDISIADLITLDRHGIRADTLRGFKEAGFTLTVPQAVDLDRHGIRVDYARDIRKAGFQDTRDIIELDRHGVRAAEVIKFKNAGYTFNKTEIIDLDRHGISSDFAAKLKSAGYHFSAKDLIDLDRHGVRADYAMQLKDAGYEFSAQDLINLDRHGVPSTFAAALRDPNKPNLSPDAIIDLNNKGLDAETIKKIRGS